MKESQDIHIEGHVSAGFEAVRHAFAENFSRRQELGGACCVYHRGEKVVDLWGGVRNKATGEPWEEDTIVLVFSATKGLAAIALAVAHSRGWLDYEERVCTYWPEFARQGKEQVTVRQFLSHQAGLFAFDALVDKSVIVDLDRLAVIMMQLPLRLGWISTFACLKASPIRGWRRSRWAVRSGRCWTCPCQPCWPC